MATRLAGTALERGQVLPGAAVREAGSGRELPIRELRGRKALVLCLLHEDCEACERFWARLSGASSDVAAADGRMVRMAEDGPSLRRFLGPDGSVPTVLITDRYAAGWESYPAPGHAFPPVEEIVSTLWHLATMCPECGVPTWE
jgi:hypothetical protein